jgi:CheY-like chemotaxis protein
VNRCVAIIEDSTEMRQLMAEILGAQGIYEVAGFEGTTVTDVRQADPAVIILDLRLGDPAGGWSLLQEIRGDPELSAVPVILCTADAAQIRERHHQLAQMPGVFILEKPFTVDNFEQLVDGAMQVAATTLQD